VSTYSLSSPTPATYIREGEKDKASARYMQMNDREISKKGKTME
jgi:hypothetical protein